MNRIIRANPGAVLCALMLVAPLAAAGWNDAGTGDDAAGHPEHAEILPDFGSYTGFLTERDRDWYRLTHDAGAACVEVEVSGASTARAMLELQGSGTRRASVDWSPAAAARIGLATPRLDETYLRLWDTDPADAGDYGFRIERDVAAGTKADTGTGGDASSLRSMATLVDAGCIAGRLGTNADGTLDLGDVYRLTAAADSTAVLTFAQSAASNVVGTMQLLDSSGDVLLSLSPGDLANVTLPYSGTYYVSMSASSVSIDLLEYVGGIVIGPPGGSPCDPACFDS